MTGKKLPPPVVKVKAKETEEGVELFRPVQYESTKADYTLVLQDDAIHLAWVLGNGKVLYADYSATKSPAMSVSLTTEEDYENVLETLEMEGYIKATAF